MEQVPSRKARLVGHLPWILVLLVACGMAVRAYRHFHAHSRHLWTSGVHDRNAHYRFGLSLALDALHGDFKELRHDLNGARVWGPLHGLLLGGLLLVAGPDYHFAVLPSLVGWTLAALLIFLLARRVVPQFGNVAGFVAATLFLVSPAHQAYATDVMLESLGACLTLLALYLYLVSVQDNTKWAARGMALTLTALFLHKYNYWLLVFIALCVNEIVRRRAELLARLKSALADVNWREWEGRELRNPLNYLILILVTVSLWILLTGGGVFQIGGTELSMRTPHNVIHVAYVLIFARLVLWWRRCGKQRVETLPLRERQMIYWHAWPAAIWFLLPKRLGYFIWFLGPNNQGEAASQGLLAGATTYWHSAVADYHVAWWSLLCAIGLTAAACACRARLRPGATVLFFFLAVSLALTVNHPNRKSRFLHTWIPSIWVLAGAGVAQLASAGSRRRPALSMRPWLAGAGAAGMLIAHAPGMLKTGRAPEGGPKPDRHSVIEVAEAYLPELEQSQNVAILCNVPLKFFSEWSFMERYGGTRNPVTDLKGYRADAELSPDQVQSWLASLRQDTIVLWNVPPGSHFHFDVNQTDYEPLRAQLKNQGVFALQRQIDLPRHGCTVEVWKRTPLQRRASGGR